MTVRQRPAVGIIKATAEQGKTIDPGQLRTVPCRTGIGPADDDTHPEFASALAITPGCWRLARHSGRRLFRSAGSGPPATRIVT